MGVSHQYSSRQTSSQPNQWVCSWNEVHLIWRNWCEGDASLHWNKRICRMIGFTVQHYERSQSTAPPCGWCKRVIWVVVISLSQVNKRWTDIPRVSTAIYVAFHCKKKYDVQILFLLHTVRHTAGCQSASTGVQVDMGKCLKTKTKTNAHEIYRQSIINKTEEKQHVLLCLNWVLCRG